MSFRLPGKSALLLLPLAACTAPEPPPLRISVVGDVLLARGVPAALARDSAALGRTARQLWGSSRYVVGNLECPLTDTARPVRKQFVFRAAPPYAGWLRRLGFTHLSLANNHTLDQHLPGLRATAATVRGAGLGVLGYQPDSLAGCRPILLGPDSSVAVFAWSAFRQGGAGEGCVCGRDFAALAERVAAYKTLFPGRAVLVYLHWGHEYVAHPDDVQRRQARQLIDCGADAVVGAHPHVPQSAEFYRGRPIVYSLGNFLFDQLGRPGTDRALQADFEVRGGRVVATYLRPLRLRGAVPYPAAGWQPATDGTARLVGEGSGGWRLVPTAGPAPADTLRAYFPRQLLLTDADGQRIGVGLRYRPLAREYQVRAASGAGSTVLDLGFPLYQFTQGDIDNDGRPELLVGPIKASHFDSTRQRRLFAYRFGPDGQLRPRWLGSKVVYRLRYFRALTDPRRRTYIRTLEQQPDGRYCIGRYYWRGFGLTLDQFTARHLSLDAAYHQFIR